MDRRTFLTAVAGMALVPEVAVAAEDSTLIATNLLADFKAACQHNGELHAPTLLSALGACAGFGCQMAVRAGVREGKIPAKGAFVVATTKDGENYYLGDQINQPLLEARISVWGLVGAAAQKAGATTLPDIHDIVRHVVGRIGWPEFGTLRVAAADQPFEKPIESLKRLWAPSQARLAGADPLFQGWHFAYAAQLFILQTKVIDPKIEAQIVMESAVAMSMIDPKNLGL